VADIGLDRPSREVEPGQFLDRVQAGIQQGGSQGHRADPESGPTDIISTLADRQGLGQRVVLLGCHPRRPDVGLIPGDDLVFRPQGTDPLRARRAGELPRIPAWGPRPIRCEVDGPPTYAEDAVQPAGHQQGQIGERPERRVPDQDIACAEFRVQECDTRHRVPVQRRDQELLKHAVAGVEPGQDACDQEAAAEA